MNAIRHLRKKCIFVNKSTTLYFVSVERIISYRIVSRLCNGCGRDRAKRRGQNLYQTMRDNSIPQNTEDVKCFFKKIRYGKNHNCLNIGEVIQELSASRISRVKSLPRNIRICRPDTARPPIPFKLRLRCTRNLIVDHGVCQVDPHPA